MSTNAEQSSLASRNQGYLDGHADAQEDKTAMTEAQLSYHGDEYAHGYRAGYANGLKSALAAAEATLGALAEKTKAAHRAYRAASDRQDAVADEIRELKRKIREGQTP